MEPTAQITPSDAIQARDGGPGGTPVRVALLGHGTVGSALHDLLVEHRDHVRLATGRDVEVCAVLVRDTGRDRPGLDADRVLVTSSLDELLASEPDVVCEAMGGIEPTRSHLLAVLDHGIPVVTANKQLVARHGPELFERAATAGAQLRFEASVCGAVPIIRMLRESLAAARVERLLGILNGTTNYMLSSMEAMGTSYESALADAQHRGFAEPDPTEDVEGIDAAAKLAILAGIAFGTTVAVEDVPATGISGLRVDDIAHAHVLGCRIRLVARAERLAGSGVDGRSTLLLGVAPMMVPEQHPLAAVTGPTNAVLVDGSPFGRLVVQGAGAGGPETASALAGDLVSVMGSEPSFLTADPHVAHLAVAPAGTRSEAHYVRLRVPDQPGVLAAVAGALAARDVSIERVLQQRADEGRATLVLTTHPCRRGDIDAALADVAEASDTDRTVLPMLDGSVEA